MWRAFYLFRFRKIISALLLFFLGFVCYLTINYLLTFFAGRIFTSNSTLLHMMTKIIPFCPFLLTLIITIIKTALMQKLIGGEIIFVPSTGIGLRIIVNLLKLQRNTLIKSDFSTIYSRINAWELHLYPNKCLPKSNYVRARHIVNFVQNINNLDIGPVTFVGLTPIEIGDFLNHLQKSHHKNIILTPDKSRYLFLVQLLT